MSLFHQYSNTMACRRKRQRRIPDPSDRHAPNNVDQLTFKYMMCKMESSTDSDSEISPRWSDTSTMGCVSSAPESSTSRRALSITHKPAVRHGVNSLFLDPYDGSSEDSDESKMEGGISSKTTRHQMKSGGCRLLARSRRLTIHTTTAVTLKETMKKGLKDEHHDAENQMKSGSESDMDGCKNPQEDARMDSTSHTQIMDVELPLTHTGLPEFPVKENPNKMPCNSSERPHSPCDLRCIYKRKLGLPAEDIVEMKRACTFRAEADRVGQDSASTPG